MRTLLPVAVMFSAIVLSNADGVPASIPSTAERQQQPGTARAGWPCDGRVDPTYFHLAEATGGQLLLLAPGEIGDSAALMTAADGHHDTIFRLAGTINPGIRQFHVPIDAAVESVVFSMSVQCLQTADVFGPDGAPPNGPDVTELSNFRAVRTVIVRRPAAGVWSLRLSGSGVAGVTVQARSAVGIRTVEFAPGASAEFTRMPTAGVQNTIRITLAGPVTRASAMTMSAEFKTLNAIPLAAAGDGTYLGQFTPGADGFRLLVTGDANGSSFQRETAQLFTATSR